MEELARNLALHDVQVVTVNWSEGAADNFTPIGLHGSRWIEMVGAWTGNQLMAAGFNGENMTNVYFVGHSWGSYVSYEAAEKMNKKIGGIIALDPAADNKFLGGKYEITQVDFSRFANTSYAIHSSKFGDITTALTAHNSFEVRAPEGYEDGNVTDISMIWWILRQRYAEALAIEVADEVRDALHEHGFAVTLFSSLLEHAKEAPDDSVAALFAPNRLSSSSPSLQTRSDHYEGCSQL